MRLRPRLCKWKVLLVRIVLVTSMVVVVLALMVCVCVSEVMATTHERSTSMAEVRKQEYLCAVKMLGLQARRKVYAGFLQHAAEAETLVRCPTGRCQRVVSDVFVRARRHR